jgi:predicted amidophosphoribosyltransferase
LHPVLAQLVAVFAPPLCAACGRPVAAATEVLCGACRRALPWLRGPRCPRCALPAPCSPCPAERLAFDAAWAPVAHTGSARTVVKALKFGAKLALADAMAAQMAAALPHDIVAAPRGSLPAPPLAVDALVAVPPARARARARGFDPAALLATALARRTGLALSPCLRRAGPETRQTGAGARARRSPGRIRVQATARAPAHVLLVDDVHTTGATLHACAQALRAAGAERVGAITYSRAL